MKSLTDEKTRIFILKTGYVDPDGATGKYIAFKPFNRKQFVRGSARSLGEEYTRESIIKDEVYDQMTLSEYIDPFTGEPVVKGK